MTDPLIHPLLILGLGIATVLGLIIVLRVNAFIALITAAILVSLLGPGDVGAKIQRVADSFGKTAGGIGIVIGLAAVIGKCMLDSGAADRIVRAFVRVLGEKRASLALLGSGYVLAIPVFFDTVFYLLVPLARSLHRRTGVHYLKYILAIAAGGALTHTLVPPTPGPLLMASTLGVDLGMMILMGAAVAAPAALFGLALASVLDSKMKTPMRPLGNAPEAPVMADDQLPGLWISLAPVLLPVVMISINTGLGTWADLEPAARVRMEEVEDWGELQSRLAADTPAATRIRESLPETAQQALAAGTLDESGRAAVVEGLNAAIQGRASWYEERAFQGLTLSPATRSSLASDQQRLGQAKRERQQRLLLEDVLRGERPALRDHVWQTSRRQAAQFGELIGNANLALLLSTVIALWTLGRQRGLTRTEMADVVETSLMSAGVIILITAAGGAFGDMLKTAQINRAIEAMFQSESGGGGASRLMFLAVGFLVAMVLKIAQGSSTVAMIVGSGMMVAIVPYDQLGCHPVYLALAIGSGSMVGSWMNDSGFWIFAKMGALTEAEALKSWTVLLSLVGVASFIFTVVLAHVLPFAR